MSDIKPSSLKVVDLRAELSKRGLPTKGKKDELVARLTEALAAAAAATADESNTTTTTTTNEPVIEEPSQVANEDAPAVEQQQTEQVTEETTVTTVVHEDATQETVVEESQKEQLIVEPAEQVAAQPSKELTQKPAEELIQKPAEQVIEEPVEQVVVQITEQVIEETKEEQIIEKPDEEMIEKPDEQTIEKPDEQLTETPQEPPVEKPAEQAIESQANDSPDIGLKRKRLEENDSPEDEKRLRTEQATPSDATNEHVSLYIKGFVRPLIIKHVQELLAKYGTVKRFWMDSIKTHCYVTYETASQAKEAFHQVNGIKFPADTGRLLTVGELTSEQADKIIDFEQNAAERRIKVDWEAMLARVMSGEATAITSPSAAAADERRVRTVGINQIITKQLAQAQAQAHPAPQANEPAAAAAARSIPPSTQPPKEISLDDLFRKTKALPPLYYLPNTDQEAKLKLEKLGH